MAWKVDLKEMVDAGPQSVAAQACLDSQAYSDGFIVCQMLVAMLQAFRQVGSEGLAHTLPPIDRAVRGLLPVIRFRERRCAEEAQQQEAQQAALALAELPPQVTGERVFQSWHGVAPELVRVAPEAALQTRLGEAGAPDIQERMADQWGQPGALETVCFDFLAQAPLCEEEARLDIQQQYFGVFRLVGGLADVTGLEGEICDCLAAWEVRRQEAQQEVPVGSVLPPQASAKCVFLLVHRAASEPVTQRGLLAAGAADQQEHLAGRQGQPCTVDPVYFESSARRLRKPLRSRAEQSCWRFCWRGARRDGESAMECLQMSLASTDGLVTPDLKQVGLLTEGLGHYVDYIECMVADADVISMRVKPFLTMYGETIACAETDAQSWDEAVRARLQLRCSLGCLRAFTASGKLEGLGAVDVCIRVLSWGACGLKESKRDMCVRPHSGSPVPLVVRLETSKVGMRFKL